MALVHDRYETLDKAGSGGEGYVLRALDRQHNRQVALKVRIMASDTERAMILREAQVLLSLRPHPNLPLVRDDFFEGDRYYIVMDWIEGESLARALADSAGGLPLDEVIRDLRPVADALDHLHDHIPPVIHRDVKPANIIRRPDGRVVLVDFGLATPRVHQDGTYAGTPGFGAPELAGDEPATPAADIYGLAATTVDLLTGEPPASSLPPLPELGRARSQKVHAVLRRALSIDPARRQSTATEFVRELATVAGLEPRPPRVRRRTAVAVAVASAAIVALAYGWIVAAAPRGPSISSRPVAADVAAQLSLKTGAVSVAGSLGGEPGAMAFGEGSLWVVDDATGDVVRLDPEHSSVVARVGAGRGSGNLTVANGSVWVTNEDERSVTRIDTQTNQVSAKIPVGNPPGGIAQSGNSLWVVGPLNGTLTEIDSQTGAVRAVYPVNDAPSGVTTGFDSVWVVNGTAGQVSRFSDTSHEVIDSLAVGRGAVSISATSDAVWIANRADRTLSRIDPTTGVVTTTDLAADPAALAADGTSLWVADEGGNRLLRIDGATRQVAEIVNLESAPHALAMSPESLFLETRAPAASHRGGTLTVVSADAPAPIDPQFGYGPPMSNAAIRLTHDTLASYRHSGGSGGSVLVPDLVRTLPTPANGGLSYTMVLRPGVSFSNGATLTPADVRQSYQRAAAAAAANGGQDFSTMPPIAGLDGCTGESCDLSTGIKIDDAAGTVTFFLTKPDPEFLYQLAYPVFGIVPASTPLGAAGNYVPGTGPYLVSDFNPTSAQVTLERNPHFQEWSADARPDGYSDTIILRGNVDTNAEIGMVERGDADVMLSDVPPDQIAAVQQQVPAQARRFSNLTTLYAFMNTTLPPFNDLRVRRAVNFAVDRDKLNGAIGALTGPATCQILPAGIPGYEPYCPYTTHPESNVWSGPDLSTAQQLVDASGTKGQPVTVWTSGLDGRANMAAASDLAGVLSALGYQAGVDQVPDYGDFNGTVGSAETHAQIGLWRWGADLPLAEDFFARLLSCDSRGSLNGAQFCDPSVDGMVAHARELESQDETAANALWAQIDRTIVDQAVWAPYSNPQGLDLISARVGDYQSNPVDGILLDQLWVH